MTTQRDSLNAKSQRRGKHPNSLANLRPYKKGQSGNAKGTPGPKITPRMERMLDMPLAEFFRIEYKTAADAVAGAYVLEAMMSGFDKSRQELIERIDGKVPNVMQADITTRKIETVVVEDHTPKGLRLVKEA